MLKLPGMKNAPPDDSRVTSGSLVGQRRARVPAEARALRRSPSAPSSSRPRLRSSPTFASCSRKPLDGRTAAAGSGRRRLVEVRGLDAQPAAQQLDVGAELGLALRSGLSSSLPRVVLLAIPESVPAGSKT
jgi:hypothetical protein